MDGLFSSRYWILLCSGVLVVPLVGWVVAKSGVFACAVLKQLDPSVRAALVSVTIVAVAVAQKSGTNSSQTVGGQLRDTAGSVGGATEKSRTPGDQIRTGESWGLTLPDELTNLVAGVRNQTLADDGDGHWTTRFNPWSVRGAADDHFHLDFADGWLFPYGTGHLSRVAVMTSGELRPSLASDSSFAAVGAPMSAVPLLSEFTCEHTPSNSYRFCWRDFFLNRDTNLPVTAVVELMRNGDWTTVSNGVSNSHEMPWPFGPTNAILAVGTVGNGQFVLTAAFPTGLEERVLMVVNTNSYCIGQGGEYRFLLDKGISYDITLSWDDDDNGVEFSWSDGTSDGGGEVEFTRQGVGSRQWRLQWSPGVVVSPSSLCWDDAGGSQPIPLSAGISLPGDVTFRWLSYLDMAEYSSPSAAVTTLVDPRGASCLKVVASNGHYSATNEIQVSYEYTGQGDSTNIEAGISVAIPEKFLIKRQAEGRLVPVELGFRSVMPTNGTLTLEINRAEFGAGTLWSDTNRTSGCEGRITWTLANVAAFSKTLYYECDEASLFKQSDLVRFTWEDPSPAGDDQVASQNFTVCELNNEPVCTIAKTVNGRKHYFNPCCAVRGEETYLSVDVNPQDILDSEISWFCESGTVAFPHGSAGREVAVVAGGDDDVVVRADFAGCPEPKMRFTLKPVDMRTVTIYPCEILDEDEDPSITRAHVEQLLQGVNDIYRQVGLQFVSAEVTTVVNTQWNKEGLSRRSVGAAIRNHMINTGGVEVYFINGSGADKEPLGRANVYGVIVRKSSGYGVLAHEIGHACKLCDIYVEKDGIRLHDDDYVLKQEHMPLDWGNYRGVVDQGVIIEELLMNGKEVGNRWYAPGRDIPLGSIFGLGKDSASTNGFSAGLMNVGERGMLLNPPHSN